ncbi:hypothetical protein G6F68_011924 [Rhizopus microsporus]|nr:hypothetical protein G6F68_011924 [Rhizopus microsporus]
MEIAVGAHAQFNAVAFLGNMGQPAAAQPQAAVRAAHLAHQQLDGAIFRQGCDGVFAVRLHRAAACVPGADLGDIAGHPAWCVAGGRCQRQQITRAALAVGIHQGAASQAPGVVHGRLPVGQVAAAGQQPVPPHRIAPVAEGVPRQQHAVEEALQQGRHRAPPGGIDQHQVIAGFDRIGDVLQIGFQGLDLAVAVAQHRVEFELAQCDQAHPVAGVFGSGGVALGEGAAQAVAVGVAQQDKDGAGHGNLGQWKVREVGLCPWGRVKRRVRRRQGSRWVAGRSRHCRSAATAVVRR